ncbi:uncharacterized protein LOC129593947 isoform X1 [Paramacrobiotus metropolitanus]|uniref:uncharacterized protein LOC129593947 isoform X1 n=1 Tax=Paramacrobiotus metropolitanus TaxID=2943436 RepID=UPI0024458270|nr:uncharacterized protein LOC129593947 isoform X1 [Paramacrobiotus metropolitanus]
METKELPLYRYNIVIVSSGKKNTLLQSRYLYSESGKSDLPETPVKSIVHAKTYFETQYFKTLSGLLKTVEMECTFIAFLASVCMSPHGFWYTSDICGYITAVSTTAIAFVATLALLIMQLFHLVDAFPAVPWNTIELVYSLVEVHCMLFAGAVMIPDSDAHTFVNKLLCVLFCWTAAIAYGINAFLFLKDIQIFRESSDQSKDLEETKVENDRTVSSKGEPIDS